MLTMCRAGLNMYPTSREDDTSAVTTNTNADCSCLVCVLPTASHRMSVFSGGCKATAVLAYGPKQFNYTDKSVTCVSCSSPGDGSSRGRGSPHSNRLSGRTLITVPDRTFSGNAKLPQE